MYIRDNELTSDRLSLKSINEIDRKDFISIFTNEKVKKTYMLPDLVSKEEKEAFFIRLKNASEDRTRFIYGIYLKKEIIGFINEVEKNLDTIELGYFISPKFWNKGYATEALGAAIKELFKMGYNHVKCAYFEGNNASKRVMEKNDMHPNNEVTIVTYRNEKLRAIYYQIDNPQLIK